MGQDISKKQSYEDRSVIVRNLEELLQIQEDWKLFQQNIHEKNTDYQNKQILDLKLYSNKRINEELFHNINKDEDKIPIIFDFLKHFPVKENIQQLKIDFKGLIFTNFNYLSVEQLANLKNQQYELKQNLQKIFPNLKISQLEPLDSCIQMSEFKNLKSMYDYHLEIKSYEFLRNLKIEELNLNGLSEITVELINLPEFKFQIIKKLKLLLQKKFENPITINIDLEGTLQDDLELLKIEEYFENTINSHNTNNNKEDSSWRNIDLQFKNEILILKMEIDLDGIEEEYLQKNQIQKKIEEKIKKINKKLKIKYIQFFEFKFENYTVSNLNHTLIIRFFQAFFKTFKNLGQVDFIRVKFDQESNMKFRKQLFNLFSVSIVGGFGGDQFSFQGLSRDDRFLMNIQYLPQIVDIENFYALDQYLRYLIRQDKLSQGAFVNQVGILSISLMECQHGFLDIQKIVQEIFFKRFSEQLQVVYMDFGGIYVQSKDVWRFSMQMYDTLKVQNAQIQLEDFTCKNLDKWAIQQKNILENRQVFDLNYLESIFQQNTEKIQFIKVLPDNLDNIVFMNLGVQNQDSSTVVEFYKNILKQKFKNLRQVRIDLTKFIKKKQIQFHGVIKIALDLYQTLVQQNRIEVENFQFLGFDRHQQWYMKFKVMNLNMIDSQSTFIREFKLQYFQRQVLIQFQKYLSFGHCLEIQEGDVERLDYLGKEDFLFVKKVSVSLKNEGNQVEILVKFLENFMPRLQLLIVNLQEIEISRVGSIEEQIKQVLGVYHPELLQKEQLIIIKQGGNRAQKNNFVSSMKHRDILIIKDLEHNAQSGSRNGKNQIFFYPYGNTVEIKSEAQNPQQLKMALFNCQLGLEDKSFSIYPCFQVQEQKDQNDNGNILQEDEEQHVSFGVVSLNQAQKYEFLLNLKESDKGVRGDKFLYGVEGKLGGEFQDLKGKTCLQMVKLERQNKYTLNVSAKGKKISVFKGDGVEENLSIDFNIQEKEIFGEEFYPFCAIGSASVQLQCKEI